MNDNTHLTPHAIDGLDCPACGSSTRFWVQANARAMCPCTARRTFTAREFDPPADFSDGAAQHTA